MNSLIKNPDDFPFPSDPLVVESCKGGFWSYYRRRRSPGMLPDAPLNQFLGWILEQISFGHSLVEKDEDGEVVSVTIGRRVPHKVSSSDEAAELSLQEHNAHCVAVVIAEAREQGCPAQLEGFHKEMWQMVNESLTRRMESHYALVFCELLDCVSKKLPELELLPIFDSAPKSTRTFLAEATRCYLLKMDRACVALCRACLEDTLKNILTAEMQDEWHGEIARTKRGPLETLINVCARHGTLGQYQKNAHYVRIEGNKVLHWSKESTKSQQPCA